MSIRQAGSLKVHGIADVGGYVIDVKRTAAIKGTPTGIVSSTLYDETAQTDVSTTALTGSTNLTGTRATGKAVDGSKLTAGHKYRYIVGIQFPDDLAGNDVILSWYLPLLAER
jgi:hypothetical protein